MEFNIVNVINEAIEDEKKNPSIAGFIALQEQVNKQVSYDADREILTNTINAEIDKLDPSRNIDMVIPRLEMVSSQISKLTPEQLGVINSKINDIQEEPKKTKLNKILSAITTVPTKRSMFSMFGRGARRKTRRKRNKKATKRK